MSGEYWVARLKAGDDRAELAVDDSPDEIVRDANIEGAANGAGEMYTQ